MKGNRQTNTDNGNVYMGTLFIIFNENGEAKGKYQFGNGNFKDNKIAILRMIKKKDDE